MIALAIGILLALLVYWAAIEVGAPVFVAVILAALIVIVGVAGAFQRGGRA